MNSNEALRYHWNVWKLTGIEKPKKFPKFLYVIYAIFINASVTILFPVTLIVNLFFTEGLQAICENLTIAITDTISNLKFLNVFIVRKKLVMVKKIISKLDQRVVDEDELIILRRSVRIAQDSFKAFSTIYLVGTILSVINVKISSVKILLYPAWFPIDWKNSHFNFLLVLSYQLFGLIVQAIQDVANDSYPPSFLCIISGHMRALNVRIRKIGLSDKSKGIDDQYENLVKCIQDHITLIELNNLIQEIISTACMAQFVCSSLVQCTVGIYFLYMIDNRDVSKLILSLIFFFAVTLEIFIICYFGHQLKQESDDLTIAIYSCDWINQSLKFKKALVIFLLRCNKENVILAGNYIPVTLPTFMAIMKYSYSVFTLLMKLK